MEFRIEKDFLKSENKKIIDEINRIDNLEKNSFFDESKNLKL